MGGFLKTVLDPAGVFDGLADPGGPTSAPANIRQRTSPDEGMFGFMADINKIKDQFNQAGPGYIGGMTGPSTGLNLPDAGKDYGPKPEAPRVAPFQAQWQFSQGKGPQWLEPVDNGTSTKQKRQGDLMQTETTDHGWSSQINSGPVKGNRF